MPFGGKNWRKIQQGGEENIEKQLPGGGEGAGGEN